MGIGLGARILSLLKRDTRVGWDGGREEYSTGGREHGEFHLAGVADSVPSHAIG